MAASSTENLSIDAFAAPRAAGALQPHRYSLGALLPGEVDMPWAEYMNVLKPNGALGIVGASPGELKVSVFGLLQGQKASAAAPSDRMRK